MKILIASTRFLCRVVPSCNVSLIEGWYAETVRCPEPSNKVLRLTFLAALLFPARDVSPAQELADAMSLSRREAVEPSRFDTGRLIEQRRAPVF